MENGHILTEFHTELSKLGISTVPTEEERKNHKFVQWNQKKQEKADKQLVKSVLSNAGINPDRNLHEQLLSY